MIKILDENDKVQIAEAIEAVEDMVSTEYTDFAMTAGSFVNQDGTLATFDGYYYSNYIPIADVNSIYTNMGGAASIAFYDTDKRFIGSMQGTVGWKWYKAISPNEAVYLRFSCKEIGEKNPACRLVSYPEIIEALNADVEALNADVEALNADVKYLEDMVFIEYTDFAMTEGGFIHAVEGGVIANDTYSYSTYIPVESVNAIYAMFGGWAGIAFYDANYDFVSGYRDTDGTEPRWHKVEAPSEAIYLRFSSKTAYTPICRLELIKQLKDKVDKNEQRFETYIQDHIFDTFNSFGVIGDSLASGAVAITSPWAGTTDIYDVSWGQFIARKTGRKCINFSKGGLTTRTWLTNEEYGQTKLLNDENKCQCYFIGLGVNDINQVNAGNYDESYIGTIDDINVEDYTQNADTFHGNYGRIISLVKSKVPDAKIFVFTLPAASSETKLQYNSAIRNIAALFTNVYVLDIADDSFYSGDKYKSIRRKTGGHFNGIGYKLIADHIYELVNKYMNDNYSEFREIELIGTGYVYTGIYENEE